MAMDLSTAKILQSVEVLRKHVSEHCDSKGKIPLLHDKMDKSLFVQITLKKIPKLKLNKMIKVSLPHSLIRDTSEVCLIVGDLDKWDRKADISKDIEYYENLLKERSVSKVTQVIPLRQLRTEYKPFEAKRRLIEHFDVFLADNRINQCLPKLLGKFSFQKRKVPIQINIRTLKLKEQIERALSEKIFIVSGRGNTCASEVAYLNMDDDKIVENVQAAAEKLFKEIPGGVDNIMGMYLLSYGAIAIPIYMNYGNPDDVVLKAEKHHEDVEAEEITTLNNGKVKVFKNGYIQIIKKNKSFQKKNDKAENNEVCDDDGIVKTSKKSTTSNRTVPKKEVMEANRYLSSSAHLSKNIKKEGEVVSKREKKRNQGSLEEKKKSIKEETDTDEDFTEDSMDETKSEEGSDEGDSEENMDSENASEENNEVSEDDVKTNKNQNASNRTVEKKKVMQANGNLNSSTHLSKNTKKEGEIVSKRKPQVDDRANKTPSISKKQIQKNLGEKKKFMKEEKDIDEDFMEFNESEECSDEGDNEENMDSEIASEEDSQVSEDIIETNKKQNASTRTVEKKKANGNLSSSNMQLSKIIKKEGEIVSKRKSQLDNQTNKTPSSSKKQIQKNLGETKKFIKEETDSDEDFIEFDESEESSYEDDNEEIMDSENVSEEDDEEVIDDYDIAKVKTNKKSNASNRTVQKKKVTEANGNLSSSNIQLSKNIKKKGEIMSERKSQVDNQASKTPSSSKKRNLDRNVSFLDSCKKENETVSEKKKPLVDPQIINTPSILKKKNQDRNTPSTNSVKKEKETVSKKKKSLVEMVNETPSSSKNRNLDKNMSLNDSLKKEKETVSKKKKSLVGMVNETPSSSKKRNLDKNMSLNDSVNSQKKRKV